MATKRRVSSKKIPTKSVRPSKKAGSATPAVPAPEPDENHRTISEGYMGKIKPVLEELFRLLPAEERIDVVKFLAGKL